jgi:4,5-DOPA dioxygenase extradiol
MQQVAGSDGTPPACPPNSITGERRRSGRDLDALLDFRHKAPAARLAHPRLEHFAPLFVSPGASTGGTESETVIDGYWYGLAKRSLQFS